MRQHLEEMELPGSNRIWVDRFFARHLVVLLLAKGFYYLLSPSNTQDINIKIEEHAYETYSKYLFVNQTDHIIREIANDEIKDAKDLK